MPFQEVRGQRIFYHLGKEGKPPLVLLSGYAGGMEFHWQALAPLLEPHFQLLMFDPRGSGRTEYLEEPFTIGDLAEDAKALMDALLLERPFLFGFSMGGFVALELSKRYGTYFNRIILCNAKRQLPVKATLAFRFLIDLLHRGVEKEVAFLSLLPWLFSEGYLSDPKKRSLIQRGFKEVTVSLKGMQLQLDAMEAFDGKDVSLDALILASKEDIFFPPEGIANLEGGHSACIESPRAILDCILEDLRRLS